MKLTRVFQELPWDSEDAGGVSKKFVGTEECPKGFFILETSGASEASRVAGNFREVKRVSIDSRNVL